MDRNKLDFVNEEEHTGSLSARRAWIETTPKPGKVKVVEVALRKESVDRNKTLPGLLIGCINVALRKESVDRNSIALVSSRASTSRSPQGERG